MYETTLKKIIKHDPVLHPIFLNVFAKNEIPSVVSQRPACFILNNQTRSQPGQHWLAVFIDESGNLEFFDSYGRAPQSFGLQKQFKALSQHITYNQQRIQGRSQLCGFYCVLYLLFKARKRSDEFFSKFVDKYDRNDRLVFEEIKSIVKKRHSLDSMSQANI